MPPPALAAALCLALACLGMIPVLSFAAAADAPAAAAKPRARDLGIPFDGTPGRYNAITDVAGVEVGHATIIRGDGPLKVGAGPVRTGVTAVLPRGREGRALAFASTFDLNGNGEMTGTHWIEDSGFLEGPVMITNTSSVGVVRDAVIAWRMRHGGADAEGYAWSLPVVAETWDGYLNDTNGFHVKPADAFAALDDARGGPVTEGNVGGGTGMICNGYKGGIGTSSRVLSARNGGYTVGVLVQCNYGLRSQLRIAGIPVGRELGGKGPWDEDLGSIIVVVATDAPLIPTQLKRMAKRVPLGLGRMGSYSGDGSGDIFIAFSTANLAAGAAQLATGRQGPPVPAMMEILPNDAQEALFLATVQATEEAIVNALVAAETMTGVDGHRVEAIPHEALRQVLKRYNRLD